MVLVPAPIDREFLEEIEMLVTVDTKSVVTLPKSARSMIVGVNAAGIINAILPAGIEQDARITPSMIRMSHESARVSMGAKATAKSFVHGMAYLTCAFSHGQGSLEQLSNGMPRHSAYALGEACAMFKMGAGSVTVAELAASVQSAIGKMLTLPAKEKAKVENRPAIAGAAVVVNTIDELDPAGVTCANARADRADEAANDNLHNATADHATKIAEAEAEAAAIKAREAADVNIVAILQAFAVNRPEFALDQLKAAAKAFGFELRKIPAKRAA